MHAFGHPADLPALQAVAAEWKLELVEDAAESLGSYFDGVHTGLFGRVAALSFNGNKIVTTGGGGAIISRDVELAARAKHLTTTARVPDRWGFVHDQVGFNYRLPNLNAALGCAQMEKLGVLLRQKRKLAQHYRAAFTSLDGVSFLAEPTGTTSNYWLNTFLIDESGSDARDVFLEVLNNGGFMVRPVWRLMHKLPMYAACPRSNLSQAESLERRIVNLPSSAHLVEQIRSEA
jgi:perosamine synthetase